MTAFFLVALMLFILRIVPIPCFFFKRSVTINSGKTAESNFTLAFITGNSCAIIEIFLTN